METWKEWEIGRVYKRLSDGKVYQAYDSSVLHGITLVPVPFIGRVLYCGQLRPAGFVLCEGEEKITRVQNRGTRNYVLVDDGGESYLVQGKYADKFEFTTEFVITKEIPHESTVKPKCEKCGKELECDCGKYADLKLFIIPGSPEMCEKVQKRLFDLKCVWNDGDTDGYEYGATSIAVGVFSTNKFTCGTTSLLDQLKWRSKHFPESELLTGQEFLDKYGEGK